MTEGCGDWNLNNNTQSEETLKKKNLNYWSRGTRCKDKEKLLTTEHTDHTDKNKEKK